MRDQDATVLVNFNKEEEINKLLKQAYEKLGEAYYEGGFEDPLPQLLPMFDQITHLKNELKKEKESAAQPEIQSEPQPAPVPEIQPEPQPAPVPEIQPEPQPAPMPEMNPQPQPAPMPELQPGPQGGPAPGNAPDSRQARPIKPVQHKFCIYCGSPLQHGDVFCSGCGHKIG